AGAGGPRRWHLKKADSECPPDGPPLPESPPAADLRLEGLQLPGGGAGEEEQGDQVGHCHQGVEDVGEIPYHLQALSGAQKGRQGEENSIERDGPAAEEKCKGRFPAELPSQDGGEGEQHDPQGDQQPPQGAQHGLKGQGGEGHAVYLPAGSVGSPQHAGGADAQARDCADHCGVEEYAGHVHIPLAGGAVCGGGGSRDGGGAHARLVGKAASGNAPASGVQGGGGHSPRRATRSGGGREGQAEHLCHGSGQSGQMPQQHCGARQQVKDRHEGHHHGADSGNPPDTAQNDHESQQSHCHPGGPGRNGEAVGQRPGDGIGLGHVPHAQGGQNCEEGEEKGQGTSQPLPPQGGAHGIHGAAAHFAAGVPLAVLDGQQALRALGGKAEEGGDLHPHQGAGAARHQGRGHAHDVSGTDGGGQRGHQGGEGGHIAGPACLGAGVTAENTFQRPAQVPPGEKA
ncbi:Multidrug export protein MepA, partial [Dysosmobacter welbionis]